MTDVRSVSLVRLRVTQYYWWHKRQTRYRDGSYIAAY